MNEPEVPAEKFSLSPDQIEALITKMAVHGEGADQRWALKILRAERETEAVLPDPLTQDEVADRLARILRAIGTRAANSGYARFFNNRRVSPQTAANALKAEDFKIDVESLPRTLKAMNRRYPELKPAKGGFPSGFPVGKGPLAQQEWVRKMSMKIEVDRARAAQLAVIKDIEGYEAKDDQPVAPAPEVHPDHPETQA